MAAAAGSAPPAGGAPLEVPFAPPHPGPHPDLEIDDDEVAGARETRLTGLLEEAADAAAAAAGDAAAVDRAVLSAASTSIDLSNSLGFAGGFRRTLAHLSVSMAPAVAGARAALEERAACRLADLDPRALGLEAARRALPPRPVVPPPAADLPAILSPRAAASLLRALVPWLMRAAPADAREGVGRTSGGLTVFDDARLPGRIGSVPFDGAGRPTGRVRLLAGGRIVGRLCAEAGNAVRPSFRDPPAIGPSNLLIAPGEGPGPEGPGGEPCLMVGAAAVVPGARVRILILRGDWRAGGAPAGAADGLAWEGPLSAILHGAVAAGPDLRFFHPGVSIGAPSLRIEGIGPWVLEGTAASRPADARPGSRPRPPAGPGGQAASR
jgi:hypothetical protein